MEYGLAEADRICSECSDELHIMSKEIRRELIIIQAQAKIREHVRYTYACCHCEQTEIAVLVVKAAVPKPVIRGSFAFPEAIDYITAQKFVPQGILS